MIRAAAPLRTGLLSCALLAASAAAAPVPSPETARECAALREQSRAGARAGKGDMVGSLRNAERCAASPALSASERAGYFVEAARIRALKEDPGGAEKAYAAALALSPDDPEALYGLAAATRDRRKPALTLAERAAERATTVRLKGAAHRLAGEIRHDMGDDAGAAASYERALLLKDGDLEALRGLVAAARKKPLEAAAHAARAQRAADGLPDWLHLAALRYCARIWLEIPDPERAAASLRHALAHDPDDLESLEALVQIKHAHGLAAGAAAGAAPPHPERARDDAAERVLESDPDDLVALEALIRVRRRQKRPAEARALAVRFLDAVPGAPAWQDVPAFMRIGLVWLELGDRAPATQSVRFARELDPRSVDVLRWAEKLGAGDGALDDPTPADAYAAVGRARMALGDAAAAERSLRKALSLRPGHLEGLTAMGRLLLDQRRPREALKFSDRLVLASLTSPDGGWEFAGRLNQLPWERAGVFDQRAQIQLELGDEKGALESLEKSLKFVPEGARALAISTDLHQRRAMKERALKRDDAAREALGEALAFCGRAIKAYEKEGLPEPVAAFAARKLELERELKVGAALAAPLPTETELPQELQRRAQAELEARRPKEALVFLDRAIAISSTVPPGQLAELFTRRARIQDEAGDADGAKKSLARALALEPGSWSALDASVRRELAAGRTKKALAHADAAVAHSRRELPARRAAALRLRASARRALKDENGAQADFHAALEADPADLDAMSELLGDARREPRAALAIVEARRPGDLALLGRWLGLRGCARAAAGDGSGAAADFAAAVKSDPQGVCAGPPFQTRRERLDPLYFDACVERFPQDAKLRLDRGVARWRRGDRDGAVADLRKAVELAPDDAAARESLASALATSPSAR